MERSSKVFKTTFLIGKGRVDRQRMSVSLVFKNKFRLSKVISKNDVLLVKFQ